MVDLLTESDPDLADFLSEGDGSFSSRALFFMRAAAEEVRNYCGWHIAPSVTETIDKLIIGSQGIILVPSLYVTDVANVVVDDNQVLDQRGYHWFQQGFIETRSPVYRHGFSGLAGAGSPVCSVTLTHGYQTCPLPVKAVIFDLMETAYDTPSGSVHSVTAPGYGVTFANEDTQVQMTPGQMTRLAPYRIGGVR